MRSATRYGLVGIGALSILSAAHALRGGTDCCGRTGNYLLGVVPNFAAAIGITFVLLSIWADQNRHATFSAAKRPFLLCASISGFGLLGWEMVQKTSDRFVFDPHDLGATFVGIVVAGLLFYSISERRGDMDGSAS